MGKMSRDQMNKVVTWVGTDSKRYRILWEIALRNEEPISRRAVWSMDIHQNKWPEMFAEDISELMDLIENPCHSALQRHIFKMLSLLPKIPEEHQGKLFDLGVNYTNNAILPIAVRVHAMELAGRIALLYPELQAELGTVLQAHLKEGSAGFRSRANKWLKKMA